jgi:hypothetical protein
MEDFFNGFMGMRIADQSTVVAAAPPGWVELVPACRPMMHFVQTNGQ